MSTLLLTNLKHESAVVNNIVLDSGGNVAAAGVVTATGNIVSAAAVSGATVSAAGNITGGNIATAGSLNVGSGQLAVNASGRVTMSAQPYILCKVFRATATVGYYSLEAKASRNLSVGTYGGDSAILAPVTGAYAINFNGITNNTTGRVDINLRKNGSVMLASLNEDNGTGFHYRTISSVLYLIAGDAIQMFHGTAVGPYYTSGSGSDLEWCNFSMTLLG